MPKLAVVLLAATDTPEAMGRMANALTTAKEFHDAGDDVKVTFDGAGTASRTPSRRRASRSPTTSGTTRACARS